jgi:hypothetical protein
LSSPLFTPGVTEANNLVIRGVASAPREKAHVGKSFHAHSDSVDPCGRAWGLHVNGWWRGGSHGPRAGAGGASSRDGSVRLGDAHNHAGTVQPDAEVPDAAHRGGACLTTARPGPCDGPRCAWVNWAWACLPPRGSNRLKAAPGVAASAARRGPWRRRGPGPGVETWRRGTAAPCVFLGVVAV